MFVDPAYAAVAEYRQFWATLEPRRVPDAGEYKRIGKGGKEVWIQASYNPILDLNGRPFKVVKYATDVTDVTAQEKFRKYLQAGVAKMLAVVDAAKRGDLTAEITLQGEDDLGQMADGLRDFLESLRGSIGNIAQMAQILADGFGGAEPVSQQMAANAEETAAQANVASAAAEQVSKNVATVATGAEEMGASIKEIAKNANEAARVATSAVKVAEKTNATVAKLGETQRRDRQRHQGHHVHRPADEPAGAERHHRGGPRRRGGQGLRRRRQRGQGTGQADRQGHRGHQPQDRGDPGRHQGRRRGHRPDRQDHQPDQRHPEHDRQRRRGADGDDRRDQPQRRRGGQGQHRDRPEHHRRGPGRAADRGGATQTQASADELADGGRPAAPGLEFKY